MKIASIFEKYINLRKQLDQGKIYKITDNTNDNIYIGSTCQTLEKRLSRHKYDYDRFLKGVYHHITSFDILKNNNYQIELLEKCNIKTKDELTARERHFIDNNDCVNKQFLKVYYDANKDKIIYIYECPCGGQYRHSNKKRHLKSKKHQKHLQSI